MPSLAPQHSANAPRTFTGLRGVVKRSQSSIATSATAVRANAAAASHMSTGRTDELPTAL
jgi:hypothetical protein